MMINGVQKKFLGMLNDIGFRSHRFRLKDSDSFLESPAQPDMNVLNSRIQLTKQKNDKNIDVFNVQICGSIHASSNSTKAENTKLTICILDVTAGQNKSQPVLAANKQLSNYDRIESSVFCYNTTLGKLIHKDTVIPDWTVVARLPADWLMFPRRGQRRLQFEIKVLASDGEQEIACTQSSFIYENASIGYLDVRDNIERTKTLTVALGFAVGAADGNLNDCEIELIKRWAKDNIIENSGKSSKIAVRKLYKALDKTVLFFRNGHRLNVQAICGEMAEIAPAGQRYDILYLCLNIARTKGTVTTEELNLLKDMIKWLDINTDKSRLMMQKVLPVDIHEVIDIEAILGITSDMCKEKARKQLNNEYRKWNSRVTHSNPHIQTQADQMLQLIAKARSQYIIK